MTIATANGRNNLSKNVLEKAQQLHGDFFRIYKGTYLMLRNVLYLVLILLIVVSASAVSSCLWAGKQALQPENIALTAGEGMTAAEFGKKYDISRQVLKKVFNLTSQDDFKKPVADFGMNEEMLNKRVNQAQAIQAEHESRNWFKIPLKGLLWVIFLLAVFNLYKERQNYRPEPKMDLYGGGLCIRHNSWKRSERPDGGNSIGRYLQRCRPLMLLCWRP